ncbi:tRNA pseudouridine38-40 synthase [Nematocida minor]|uniref:tRNA pseudouridine38-40 synthase n=1 Tax=Nematocida minor TaxID=1912983 RepID=UPI00221ED661|nr:tRNA pseudouridine38-40 synthase [Nematocida minor]KAI5189875.1 tRNA pseudouridine38-40 synthase [Nematocida minor]
MGKKRVALIIGYNGIGYKGSQINKEEHTIEKTVCDEIYGLGYISARNAENYSKVGLQRSSRTDKGVHAAMLVVSLKIEIGESRSCKDLEEKLREVLHPHSIVLHRIVETTKNFDAKAGCESRVYEYFVPQSAYTAEGDSAENISRKTEIFTKVLKSMEGTHNFHNFTVQNQEKGPNRYIKEITVEKLVFDGVVWHKVVLHGQSFMIHQIRKMIGFAVLSAQRAKEESDIARYLASVFTPEKRNIPKVPGSLLLLSHSYFNNYNQRFGEERGVLDNAGCDAYKIDTLYPAVCTRENADTFKEWQEVIEKHADEFSYLQ